MRTAFPGMQFKQLKDIEEVDEDKVVYHFLSVKSTVAGEPYLVRILPGVTNDIVKPVVKNKFLLATKPSDELIAVIRPFQVHWNLRSDSDARRRSLPLCECRRYRPRTSKHRRQSERTPCLFPSARTLRNMRI